MTGFRQKNGKWEYRFSHNGERYSVTADTQKECKEKSRKRILEASAGVKRDARTVTWKEYTQNEWLEAKKITCRKSTVNSYEKKLKMLKRLDNKKITEIDRRDIIMLQAYLSKKYVSSSVNWLMAMVKNIFDSAMADDLIIKNPVIQIKPLERKEPKAVETIHKAFTKEEQEAFLAQARKQNSFYLELFEFMLVTGVRVGEAAALTWKDVDDSIHITKTIAKIGGTDKFGIQPTKTGAGTRDLPLTPDAKKILTRQKMRVAEHKGVAYTAKDQRIFYGFEGKHDYADCSRVDNAMKYICQQIGMDKRTSHSFRDTYATRCALQGMQPNTLKKLMGHSKIEMTMNLYAQIFPEDMEEAMAKISIL